MRIDPLVLATSLVGTLMGILSLSGLYGPDVEVMLWFAWALVLWIPVAVWRVKRPLLPLTIVGASAGLQMGILQAFFAHILIENNPGVYNGPASIQVRFFFLALSLVAGTVQGIVSGLVAWAIVYARRPPTVAAT